MKENFRSYRERRNRGCSGIKLTGIYGEDHFLRGTMTKLYLFVFGVMVVLSQQRGAVQDLMGTWQGVLRANSQGQRTVIKILKDDGGVLQGALYPIDEGAVICPVFQMMARVICALLIIPLFRLTGCGEEQSWISSFRCCTSRSIGPKRPASNIGSH